MEPAGTENKKAVSPIPQGLMDRFRTHLDLLCRTRLDALGWTTVRLAMRQRGGSPRCCQVQTTPANSEDPPQVCAALAILDGIIPIEGLPRALEPSDAIVICPPDDRESFLQKFDPRGLVLRGLTIEDEEALGYFGGPADPRAVLTVHLAAIQECLSLLCDLTLDEPVSPSWPLENQRLVSRLAFACHDELDELLKGYMKAEAEARVCHG